MNILIFFIIIKIYSFFKNNKFLLYLHAPGISNKYNFNFELALSTILTTTERHPLLHNVYRRVIREAQRPSDLSHKPHLLNYINL